MPRREAARSPITPGGSATGSRTVPAITTSPGAGGRVAFRSTAPAILRLTSVRSPRAVAPCDRRARTASLSGRSGAPGIACGSTRIGRTITLSKRGSRLELPAAPDAQVSCSATAANPQYSKRLSRLMIPFPRLSLDRLPNGYDEGVTAFPVFGTAVPTLNYISFGV